MSKVVEIKIDNKTVDFDINGDFPIAIDYQLEDVQDFQKKKSSEALDIKVPATLNNDAIFNTFHNPSVNDNSQKQKFRNIRDITIIANGDELLIGKTFLKKAVTQYGKPKDYTFSAYGNNADWMIALKESTIYDFTKHISFIFENATIVNSWDFDGTNENLPYVFAPVKYAGWLDPDNATDNNYHIKTMRPALSKYWILYWAFKSLGYRIQSEFLNTPYFRRQVMPWTFGNFLTTEGTKFDVHNFLAKSDQRYYINAEADEHWNLGVSNDYQNGAFDNNTINHADPNGGDYTWHPSNDGEMRWTYNTPHYGPLEAQLSLNIDYDAACNAGSVKAWVKWYHTPASTGVENYIQHEQIINMVQSMGGASEAMSKTVFFNQTVDPGDAISCRIKLEMTHSKLGFSRCEAEILEFKTEFFKIPVGGNVQFDACIGLKNYKVLDFFKGLIDEFNLSVQTDPLNKIVVIEPTHDYSLDNTINKNQGYFTNKNPEFNNWSEKIDLSQESEFILFDDYERELIFKYKEDSNDGAYKLVKDRSLSDLGKAKFVFPERFKAGKKDVENRFFSNVMHYGATSFKQITGITPQLICMVPENISNTSSSESDNTFLPKSAYYKGICEGVGGWRYNGNNYTSIPFLFAVNYFVGGHNDPVLSYCDEKIGIEGNYNQATGLLKRFFWQRLAIMRNGQYLNESYNLENIDVNNWFHRERIIINGNLYELIKINGYKPLGNESTRCELRKYHPITVEELRSTFPSENSVINDSINGNSLDLKYGRLICLATDIPTPQ